MRTRSAGPFACLCLLVSACAPSSQTVYVPPPAEAWDVQLGRRATVFVSEADLARTDTLDLLNLTSLLGADLLFADLMTNHRINTGRIVSAYGVRYLRRYYPDVRLNSQRDDDLNVTIEIVDAETSGEAGKGFLHLAFTVNTDQKKPLFFKTYAAEGRDHAPVYRGGQEKQIQLTTQDVFNSIFDQFAADLKDAVLSQ